MLLQHLGTCDGDMEKGHLRADVNVSVRKPGAALGHTLRDQEPQFVPLHQRRDQDEVERQIKFLETGGTIEQETRLFDPDKGETRAMRSKEEAHDYRYFPDPDLLPLELSQTYVDESSKPIAGTSGSRNGVRYENEYGLSVYNAGVIFATRRKDRLLRRR